MSKYLNGAISKGALHLFVHNGRHNIKELLGFLPVIEQNLTSGSDAVQTTDELLQDDSGKTILTIYKFTIPNTYIILIFNNYF